MKLSVIIVSLIALAGCATGNSLPEEPVVDSDVNEDPEPTVVSGNRNSSSSSGGEVTDALDEGCYRVHQWWGDCLIQATVCPGVLTKPFIRCLPPPEPMLPGDYIPDPPPPWVDNHNPSSPRETK